MGRHKEAPYGFDCPYQNACPHLGGISTTWAGLLLRDAEHDDLRDGQMGVYAEKEIKGLEAQLEPLRKENERLRAESPQPRARLFS